jgi:hypothetical protein
MEIEHDKVSYGREGYIETLRVNGCIRMTRDVHKVQVRYRAYTPAGRKVLDECHEHPGMTPTLAWSVMDNDWFALKRMLYPGK